MSVCETDTNCAGAERCYPNSYGVPRGLFNDNVNASNDRVTRE
jgi:hypothetical protein